MPQDCGSADGYQHYNVYLIVVHTYYTHIGQNNLRTPQLVDKACQLGCKNNSTTCNLYVISYKESFQKDNKKLPHYKRPY